MNRLLFILLFLASAARALCPHEVLVIANDDSLDSVLVAKTFLRLRDIPEANLVRLSIPEEVYKGGRGISPKEFTTLIWNPVQKALDERGLRRHILVWAYSTDIPFHVKTHPEISTTGLTFLRNRLPADLVEALGHPVDGKTKSDPNLSMYVSPLFAGPNDKAAPQPASKTFEHLHSALLNDMPIPAMYLGWTEPRGNTVDEILDCLKRGRASDGTRPSGPVVFSTNEDIRSTSRSWEYPGVCSALPLLGVHAESTPVFPKEGLVCGFMTGMANLPASGMQFLPGAYADHFTSCAALFHGSSQTKLSEWIRRGATASSGAVTEPYAYWQKFPGAALFLHQARGCTMVEAIYQSVRCPLQLLPVGDPLARPWGVIPRVSVAGLPTGPVSGRVEVSATTDQPDLFSRFDWLVDGRPVGSGATHLLDTVLLSNGTHRLRAVARNRGPLRHNGHAEVAFEVRNP